MAHKNVRLDFSFVYLYSFVAKVYFWSFPQNFVMRGSRQTLPTLLEECSDTKLLCGIATNTFDAGQAYSNSKVDILNNFTFL